MKKTRYYLRRVQKPFLMFHGNYKVPFNHNTETVNSMDGRNWNKDEGYSFYFDEEEQVIPMLKLMAQKLQELDINEIRYEW